MTARIYQIAVLHVDRVIEEKSTHLDLEKDQVKLRQLLLDAAQRRRTPIRELELHVRELGANSLAIPPYITTEAG